VTKPKVLVIDDGERYVELFHALLRDYEYATRCELPGPCWECPHREGCELTHAHDWAETEQALARHDQLDVVLLDVRFELPGSRLLGEGALEDRKRRQGLLILEKLREKRGDLPVVLMTSKEELGTGHASIEADEYVALAGADAFDARALELLVARTLSRRRVAPDAGGYVWGQSPAMGRLRRDARALARTSLPILLLGETGTGKSALAERVLHAESGRSGEFVSVDLSALPESLVAAELFGATKGAYSGAVDRRGRFEEADGGTLFLDEIGNLPLDVQRMLLLALQDGRITRLGESRPRRVDVKLIAATNADLEAAVHEGTFRADLYARLNPAARLTVPPLRERLVDLRILAEAFVERLFADGPDRALLARYQEVAEVEGAPRARLSFGRAPDAGVSIPPAGRGVTFVLPRSSLQKLRAHDWPGNVRELELLIANAVLMSLGDALDVAEVRPDAPLAHAIPIPAKLVGELLEASWVRAGSEGVTQLQAGSLERRGHLRDVARDLERQLFERLFHETGGDFRAMAERLLTGDPKGNARRVRMRFNQLGLKARELRRG